MTWNLNDVVVQCDDMVSLPEIYLKLSEKIDRPETTNNELADLVKLEPGVASKLLTIVNSPFYGLAGTIATPAHAISIIGRNDFKNLVLGSCVVEVFRKLPCQVFTLRRYWEHCLLVAICSKLLGKHWRLNEDRELLFVAGLLHDIGKLVVAQVLPQQADLLAPVWQPVDGGRVDDNTGEEALLGFTHAEAGAELLKAWGLPGLLQLAAGHHHQPELADVHQTALHIVYVANVLASGECEAIEQSLEVCRRVLGVEDSTEALLELLEEAQQEKAQLIGVYLS